MRYENDRSPNRPSAYLKEMFFALMEKWSRNRPAMVEADSVVSHVQEMTIAEVIEVLEELDKTSFDLDLLTKEIADVLVLIMAIFTNNITKFTGEIPNFAKIEQITNGQASSADIFQDKMLDLNRPDAIGDLQDLVALRANIEKLLIITGSFINHGVALPNPKYMLTVIERVIAKNVKNYPAEYFGNIHWLTSEKLTSPQMIAMYEHATKCLKLIRKHTGNDTEGLNKIFHRPFRFLIHDFEHSDQAFAQLENLLNGGYIQTIMSLQAQGAYDEKMLTVQLNYRSPKELLVRPSEEITELIFDGSLKKNSVNVA